MTLTIRTRDCRLYEPNWPACGEILKWLSFWVYCAEHDAKDIYGPPHAYSSTALGLMLAYQAPSTIYDTYGRQRVEGYSRWVVGDELHALYCKLVRCVHTQGRTGFSCRTLEINFPNFDRVNRVDRSKLWVWKVSRGRWRGHTVSPWRGCYGRKVAEYLRTHKVRSILWLWGSCTVWPCKCQWLPVELLLTGDR